MKEEKEFIEIHLESIKLRIRYLDDRDPGKEELDAIVNRISHDLSQKRKT